MQSISISLGKQMKNTMGPIISLLQRLAVSMLYNHILN